MADSAEWLQVRPVERPLEVHVQGDDVVHLGGELGAPGPCARPAEGLGPEHLGTDVLPSARAVNLSYGGIAAGTVVLGVRVAAATEDPS